MNTKKNTELEVMQMVISAASEIHYGPYNVQTNFIHYSYDGRLFFLSVINEPVNWQEDLLSCVCPQSYCRDTQIQDVLKHSSVLQPRMSIAAPSKSPTNSGFEQCHVPVCH